eukprot:scaffold98639_cov21-Prasinocladus_malaysianus.AAC.1
MTSMERYHGGIGNDGKQPKASMSQMRLQKMTKETLTLGRDNLNTRFQDFTVKRFGSPASPFMNEPEALLG